MPVSHSKRNGKYVFNFKDFYASVNSALSELEVLNTGIPETEKQLQEAQLELAQVQKDEVTVSAELRTHRAQVEETRSSMQASRSRGRVLDSLMEQKQLGHLPGIYGRLVSQEHW
jgi:structural maintenance of chromosome 4